MENNPKTIEKRQEKDKQALLDALKEMPIIAVACKRAGIGRATYYRWRKEDKNFLVQSDEAMSQGVEFINDMSESQLISLIKEKKMPAIALWLRHNHPRYGEKLEITARIKEPEMSPEQQALVEEALGLASIKDKKSEINEQL